MPRFALDRQVFEFDGCRLPRRDVLGFRMVRRPQSFDFEGCWCVATGVWDFEACLRVSALVRWLWLLQRSQAAQLPASFLAMAP